MSGGYCVRNDGLGWRSVNTDTECIEGETFSLTAPNPNEPSPGQLWYEYQQTARMALNDVPVVALAAYRRGVIWPAEWKTYETSLLAITTATSIGDYTLPLPTRPADPQVTSNEPNLNTIIELSTVTQDEAPIEGGTIQIQNGARDVMLAIAAAGPLNEITIKMPSIANARMNQRVQFGTAHSIGNIVWLANDADTGVIVSEAPSMLNAGESGAIQRTEPNIWFKAD